jgi:hypothetical protein
VPVDVATFLLNEKRADVLAVETRFKVNVLLVPNRHLDTPNYSVQRMRHDELNQGEPLPASFQMVEQPEDMDAFARKEEPKEPRQEAVVKGITPSQPAPVGVPRAPVATEAAAPSPPSHSWLSRMLHWFRTPPPTVNEEPAPAAIRTTTERPREARPPRNRDASRESRPRGDGRPDSAQRRDERRPERARRDARGGEESRRAEPQGTPETPRAPQGPRKEGERREPRRDTREGKGAASGRPPRAPRAEQKDAARNDAKPATETASTAGAPDAMDSVRPAAPGNGADEHREAGSRRRRGRRGRGGERGDRGERKGPVSPGEDSGASAAASSEGESKGASVPAALVDSTPHVDTLESGARAPHFDTLDSGAPASSLVTPAETESRAGSLVTSAEASVLDGTFQPMTQTPSVRTHDREAQDATPALSALVDNLDARSLDATPQWAPEPSVASAIEEAGPRQDPHPPIGMTLPPESDLVLVETRFAGPSPEDAASELPRPRRARPPRITVPEEPLQIVETRKHDGA